MLRRHFLMTSPAFLAALALSAKAVGVLPVGFPEEPKAVVSMWFRLYAFVDSDVLWACADPGAGWREVRYTPGSVTFAA